MTLEELLKAQGLTDEQITAIIGSMKENKIYTTNEENLDIRFNKLKTDNEAVIKERDEAKNLIEELQKSSKGNEDMQKQFTEYQQRVEELEKENTQIKIDSALKLALQNAKVTDTDYMAYRIVEKLKKEGKELELDETGNAIKGVESYIEEEKKANPTFFETEHKKDVVEKVIGKGNAGGDSEPKNLLEALEQKYNPTNNI